MLHLDRLTFTLLILGAFLCGACVGIGAAFSWLIAVDLQLGFEAIGSRVVECLTR